MTSDSQPPAPVEQELFHVEQSPAREQNVPRGTIPGGTGNSILDRFLQLESDKVGPPESGVPTRPYGTRDTMAAGLDRVSLLSDAVAELARRVAALEAQVARGSVHRGLR